MGIFLKMNGTRKRHFTATRTGGTRGGSSIETDCRRSPHNGLTATPTERPRSAVPATPSLQNHKDDVTGAGNAGARTVMQGWYLQGWYCRSGAAGKAPQCCIYE